MLEKKIQSFWIHFFFMNQICYKSPPNQPEKSVEKIGFAFCISAPLCFYSSYATSQMSSFG